MMLKAFAAFAFLALCYAEEHKGHAYSSQSIVLHHIEHKHHEPEHHESHAPQHYDSHEPQHYESHEPQHYESHAPQHHESHESQHYESHAPQHHESHASQHYESHEPQHQVEVVVPVITKKVVSVPHYVVESSGQEQHGHQYEHHDHKPAISSQHIERHDIPANPPKGFFDHQGPAKYEFEYKVHDPHTHDVKQQHEAREGHKVYGVYSLHEADGSIRTVKYSADKKTGFQADVQHTTKHVEESKHHH